MNSQSGAFGNIISKKFAPRVLDLSQKHPIWAPLALVLYEC